MQYCFKLASIIMNKANDKSPIFRFNEDPIHAMIMETLTKKPINSDHYSLVKRIKISDYAHRPVSTENLDTVVKRSKDYMSSVGFEYGRLLEKNWGSHTIRNEKLRIHAPGPSIRTKFNDEDIEEFDIPEMARVKKLAGFQKPKIEENKKHSASNTTKVRVSQTRPATQLSASQRQAREYLNYLNALSSNENEFILTQISQKKKEIAQQLEGEAKKRENKLNETGIFSPIFNKERVKSMIPVKMLSKNKVCIEPMLRNAKEIVMKEKMKDLQIESFELNKTQSRTIEKSPKKENLMHVFESIITKKQIKKKREIPIASPQKKVKMHWVDRLNQTMSEMMTKTMPDEKLSTMLSNINPYLK